MAEYVKGDIVLTPFPLSGEEGFKVRPALVMAVLTYGRGFDCLLCIITTQKADDPYLLSLDISDIEGGRLTQQCYLRPTYTYAVSEGMIKRRLGHLRADKIAIAVQSLVSVLTRSANLTITLFVSMPRTIFPAYCL